MKKQIAISLLILLSIIGCDRTLKDNENKIAPKIEIFLPKERIKIQDGVAITREWNFIESTRNDSSMIVTNNILLEYARLDTITQNYIYAGSYEATENDLKNNPFIYENEIISFDFQTSEIELTASAVEKLWHLQPDFNYSRQFVITSNRKPILTGYFYSSFSSSYVKHFFIMHESGSVSMEKPKFENRKFRIEYNPESEYNFDLEKYDFTQEPLFYKSFKESGKIAQKTYG